MGKLFLLYEPSKVTFYTEDILIKRKPRPKDETHVLKIPIIQSTL
jgi:hypothetical protein